MLTCLTFTQNTAESACDETADKEGDRGCEREGQPRGCDNLRNLIHVQIYI